MSSKESHASKDSHTSKESHASKAVLIPSKIYNNIKTISNDDLNNKHMLSLIEFFILENGLVNHNLKGYNNFVQHGLSRIMTEYFKIDTHIKNINKGSKFQLESPIESYQMKINFHNINMAMPTQTVFSECQHTYLFPSRARLTGLPYAGQITISATVTIIAHFKNGQTEEKVSEISSTPIGFFPVMVGSNRCHLHNMTKNGLKLIGEDPNDQGGYYIMKNNDYVIVSNENIKYNISHIHIVNKNGEAVRTEFLSQPGGAFENSSQVKIRFMINGQINIEINSTKLSNKRLPFWLIYRLLGMTSDRDIVNTIVFDINDTSPITTKLKEIVCNALHIADANFKPLVDIMERREIIQMTAERVNRYLTPENTAYRKNDSASQQANQDLILILNSTLFPHIKDKDKLKFLGLIIRKTLLVHLKVIPPTDRDSYSNKRVHDAALSLAKAFKTDFNVIHIKSLLAGFRRELKNNPWETITKTSIMDTFKNSIIVSDFNKAIEQSITSGNNIITIKRQGIVNRVSSQTLEIKNGLNRLSSLRMVLTPQSGNASKQTKRADEIRRVHATYPGFICLIQSADTGESVGMQKQLAITAGICSAGDSSSLKFYLKMDKDIIPIDSIRSEQILRENLAFIYVDGDLIGYSRDANLLVDRYRKLRREKKIVDMHTTIYWKTLLNEVEFWLDVGRLYRPLLIVDNNLEEFDSDCMRSHKAGKEPTVDFIQNIRLTTEHIHKLMNGDIIFSDLVEEGIFEYITPEEQENCLIAKSIEVLKRDKNDYCNVYTHCEIPQAVLGLAALASPYANYTQPSRITMSTNHSRQAGGWYSPTYPERLDKNKFFQWFNETPIVRTLTNKFITPNGMNIIIAYTSYGGNNQEDSAIINKASADRGLFAGIFFKYEMIELESGEKFCNPDFLTTKNIKPNASYEKLVNGFIRVGSIVNYGDVIIGRVSKINKGKLAGDNYTYTDRSIVYRLNEPAYVVSVIETRGANDEQFGIVKLRYNRKLSTGDKMASRCGNKSIVAEELSQSDMPFTQSGITPDVIINPHSFPTRMVNGQAIETIIGKICSKKGSITDGTAFLDVDHDEIIEEMIKCGYHYSGKERLYNGKTGEYMNASIFMGPCYMQRLLKFVLDDGQCVAGSCPTDPITGQPLGGKSVQGGLRIGEMETWCLHSHGSMANSYEKHSMDSDGLLIYLCRTCGKPAICNEDRNVYICKTCNEFAEIVAVESTKSSNAFIEALAASNVGITNGLTKKTFEKYL